MIDERALSADEERPILLKLADGVGRIVLNRERKLNSLNAELESQLLLALEACEADDSVRSIVIAGAGDNFCAGADIEEMLAAEHDIFGYMNDAFRFFCRVEDCPKPVIARVDGYCLGGGFELALACDVIVASDRAKFGLPETRFGLVPGFAIQRLAAMVGVAAASNILFSRRFTPAPVAQALGLLEIVMDIQELDEAVRSVTDNLAQLHPAAVSTVKQALRVHRRHAANLDHSAWANTAMFARSSTNDALRGLDKGSRRRTVQQLPKGPIDERENQDVIQG
ncbi:MAG TPA: enoyl-CoA hydratase/isomerase family protein [Streptosporangiaceae bacterium]